MSTGNVRWILAGFLVAAASSAAAADHQTDGTKLFVEQGCNKCHAMAKFDIAAKIESEKMKGPDMSAIGAERDGDWMRKWLLKEIELEGKTHKGKWEGTEKNLAALVDWLATQKEK